MRLVRWDGPVANATGLSVHSRASLHYPMLNRLAAAAAADTILYGVIWVMLGLPSPPVNKCMHGIHLFGGVDPMGSFGAPRDP